MIIVSRLAHIATGIQAIFDINMLGWWNADGTQCGVKVTIQHLYLTQSSMCGDTIVLDSSDKSGELVFSYNFVFGDCEYVVRLFSFSRWSLYRSTSERSTTLLTLIRPHRFKHSDRIQQTNLWPGYRAKWVSVFEWIKCQVERKLKIYGNQRQYALKQEHNQRSGRTRIYSCSSMTNCSRYTFQRPTTTMSLSGGNWKGSYIFFDYLFF